jgi:capsular exopolysaccharide synthesis family protein
MVATAESLPGAASERDLEVRYYLDLLWRGRLVIAAATAAGLLLGVLVALLQTPEYRASAMVQIDPPTPTALSVTDALVGGGNYWQNADFYNTQFNVLRSRGVAEKVIEQLKLKDRAPFRGSSDPARIFQSHVTIEPVPESRLVMVQITHTDPKEAALWANTLADVYVDQSVAVMVDSARRAYDWLQERLVATQQKMREAQDKLFRSYQTQDLFVPEGSVSAVSTSITKLTGDFIEAQARRIALEAALKQIAQMRAAGQSLDSVPQVAADSGVQSINSQLSVMDLELTRLKEKFREAHPEVQRVQSQVQELRKAKEARFQQVIEALRSEYGQLQKRETELKVAIDSQKAQATAQSRKGSELEALKKESESASNLYQVLLQKLSETDIAASIRTNNVRLVERASPPNSPIRPDRRKIAGAGLVLGLALGVGLVLGHEYLQNTIKDPDEVERYLHMNLIASVPKYDEDTVHLVTEAYQNIRTGLIFGRKEQGAQVVLISGTAPQEGKTTTLVNLAKLLASSGEKTVVLDCDLRRAQLHERLGLRREPGLTNYFVEQEDLDRLVRQTRVPNLYALTAGTLPPNPPAILTRKNFPDLLDHLRRHFEWILVDSPPLASVTDALLLARHADMTIFVIQHNKVDKKLVKRNVSALRRVSDNILGAVLNAVDVKAKPYYYYYYSQAYREVEARPQPARRAG